jgi:DNA-binding NarL/FixJ family response regulator
VPNGPRDNAAKGITVRNSAGSSRNTAIVIADRNPHIRETLRRVLCQKGLVERTEETCSLRGALGIVRRKGARIVLLDVELAMGQPAARLRRIVDGIPGLKVIVLLNEDLPGYRQAIAERWGYECVAKERAEIELPDALVRLLPSLSAKEA